MTVLARWRRPTLYRRLYLGAIAGLVLLLLIQGLLAARRLLGEQAETVAEELGQAAQAFAELLAEPGLDDNSRASQARTLARLKREMTPIAMAPDEFRYSVWSRDGRLLASSMPGLPQPRPDLPGRLQTLSLQGQQWRSLARTSADGRVVAVVAQAQSVYRRLGLELLSQAAGISLAAACLLALWIAISTRIGLAPLQQAAAQLRQRKAGQLRPLNRLSEHQELEPLLDAIDALMIRVEHLVQAERTFFADAAHELRTPLAAIAAQAHVLAQAEDRAERQEALPALEQAVQRSATLLSKLLTLSRLDTLGQTAGPCDLATLAREQLLHWAACAQSRQISLGFEGPTHARVPIDREALLALLDNLLDNALRHTPAQGSVVLGIEVDRAHLRLHVADSGPGIAPALREQVFERFRRAAGQGGTGGGLGLAIVRRTAELHGGRAWVEASPAGGARLVVELPMLSQG